MNSQISLSGDTRMILQSLPGLELRLFTAACSVLCSAAAKVLVLTSDFLLRSSAHTPSGLSLQLHTTQMQGAGSISILSVFAGSVMSDFDFSVGNFSLLLQAKFMKSMQRIQIFWIIHKCVFLRHGGVECAGYR